MIRRIVLATVVLVFFIGTSVAYSAPGRAGGSWSPFAAKAHRLAKVHRVSRLALGSPLRGGHWRKHKPPRPSPTPTVSPSPTGMPTPDPTDPPTEPPTPAPTDPPTEPPTPAPTDPPSATPTPTPTIDPATDLLLRTDFIYGIEIGEAETFEHGDCLDNATVRQRVLDLHAPVVRMGVPDTFTDLKRPDGKSGTLTRAALADTVRAITALGAVPWVKLMPIDAPGGDYYYGGAWVPPLADLGRDLGTYEAILAEIAKAYRGPIVIESDNEGDIDCWKKWGFSYEGDAGVSAALGRKFAQTMPALKKYCRDTLGFSQVVTVGYVGVSGGPGWGDAVTPDASQPYGYRCAYYARSIDEFNDAIYAAFIAAGKDPDCLPNVESIHTYNHNADFAANPYVFPDNECYAFYRTWLTETKAHVASDLHGYGSNIVYSISEWNAGANDAANDTWAGYSTPAAVATFYRDWFRFLRGDGQLGRSGSTGTRFWNANCYEVASEAASSPNHFYNLIDPNGTTPAWYDAFKEMSTGDPDR